VTATFIGIDLAWAVDRNHTGIVVLRGDERGARFVTAANGIKALTGVVEFVQKHGSESTVVAVDAPLIVNNTTGSRECELAIGRKFGRFQASCHSNNLTRTPKPAGMRLVAALAPLGFRHDFDIARARQRNGRWLFEVYPHPAMVTLFGLERIHKYKKGSVVQKRGGLAELQRHLWALTEGSRGLIGTPELHELLSSDLLKLKGEALKRYEDTLDALFCAYLAWHCWRWGEDRNVQFGDLEHGYIVVPTGIGHAGAG
jgi:predicted RNase H-like nuclease